MLSGATYMLEELTADEMKELHLAVRARARANGSGTHPHKLCVSILEKMEAAEQKPRINGERKAFGIDTAKHKGW